MTQPVATIFLDVNLHFITHLFAILEYREKKHQFHGYLHVVKVVCLDDLFPPLGFRFFLLWLWFRVNCERINCW